MSGNYDIESKENIRTHKFFERHSHGDTFAILLQEAS